MKRKDITITTCLIGSSFLFGCQGAGQNGSFLGAGIGALAGQAIGGDTEATLIGTSIGAVVGYAIGNEMDKQQQHQRQANGVTHTTSTTRRVLNPNGTVTTTGTEVINSQKTQGGYQGLPENN